MKEGDVVVVTAASENRIEAQRDAERVGTLVLLTSSIAVVLMPSGILWTGSPRSCFKEKNEEA